MKQIFCITAYKEFEYLEKLALNLSQENCLVYIHIDKKTVNDKIMKRLNKIPYVTAISKYKVPWGGYQHILAVLELFELAYADNSNGRCYYHVITGQDFLCKTREDLFVFFSEQNFRNYMSCSNNSNNIFRYRTFYRNDVLNYKSKIGNFLTKSVYILQKCVGINRKLPFEYEIFKGMIYVSVTGEFARYVLEYIKTADGKKFFKWIKWCFVPEEFFFQTIAMNSKFAETVEVNNHRYALWKEKHGSQPGILDEEDYYEIKKSDAFFARKISMGISERLLDKF